MVAQNTIHNEPGKTKAQWVVSTRRPEEIKEPASQKRQPLRGRAKSLTRLWVRCQVCGVWPAATVKVRRPGQRLRRSRQKLATCAGCADMIEACFVYWMRPNTDVLDIYRSMDVEP